MDPTGGIGLWAALGILVVIALLWVLAPFWWALGVSVALVVAFIAFIFVVFSNASFH